eukprot:8712066-Pyramimonas_sp.AAC.3
MLNIRKSTFDSKNKRSVHSLAEVDKGADGGGCLQVGSASAVLEGLEQLEKTELELEPVLRRHRSSLLAEIRAADKDLTALTGKHLDRLISKLDKDVG